MYTMDPAIQAAMSQIDPQGVEMLNSRLAAELACGLADTKIIMSRYGMDEAELKGLLGNNVFRSMVKEAQRVWHSDLNADERVRVKALIATEDSIPEVYAIFWNKELTPSIRLDAFKQLTGIAGVDSKARASRAGEAQQQAGFSITMNFGDPAHNMVIEGDVADA